jgi:Family of unknown function (DUF6101)
MTAEVRQLPGVKQGWAMTACQTREPGGRLPRRGGSRTKAADAATSAEVTTACQRSEDGLKRVEISAEWICIRRRIGGLETWVNVPTLSYRGVNLRAVAEGGLFEIILMHMDPSLEIVLTRTLDDTDVIALWRSYARKLALPLLVEDSHGRLQPMEDHAHLNPFPRRHGSPLKNRRPRFLARRSTGSVRELAMHLGERELFVAG